MKKVKLNLGCGANPQLRFPSPWVNADSREGCADIVADIRNIPSEYYGSCDEVYVSHVLEHFPVNECAQVLSHWKELLVPGGVLRLVVPDARIVAQAILKGSDSKGRAAISALETTPILTQVFGLGYENKDMDPLMRHHFLFTSESLIELLDLCGFTDPQVYDRSEDPSVQYKFNNDASGPFSLFCKAYKPLKH